LRHDSKLVSQALCQLLHGCACQHASIQPKQVKPLCGMLSKECRLLVHAIWLQQQCHACCKEVATQACDEPLMMTVYTRYYSQRAQCHCCTTHSFSQKATGHTCQSSSVSIPIILRRGSLDACNSSLGSGGAISCITGVPMPNSSLGSEFICKARPEDKDASQLLISFSTEFGYCQSAGCVNTPRCSDAKATAVSSEAE